MILWLDDIRDPANFGFIGAHWALNAEEAIAALKTGEVTFASLDHDLSIQATLGLWDKEVTGYDVLTWMEENNVWPKDGVRVHTANPAGRQRMEQVLSKYYKYKTKNTFHNNKERYASY